MDLSRHESRPINYVIEKLVIIKMRRRRRREIIGKREVWKN